ncbi:MAG: hypothetical protein QXF88_01125 [Candidatus Aenigmatarchaeota archaeon]
MPILTKIAGVGLIIFGLATVLFATTATQHQPPPIGNAVVLFGLGMIALGFLLFFV